MCLFSCLFFWLWKVFIHCGTGEGVSVALTQILQLKHILLLLILPWMLTLYLSLVLGHWIVADIALDSCSALIHYLVNW
jgi:hypothetical protein